MSSSIPIRTNDAPQPVGPYNQAIKAGDFIYCSGQIAINPENNQIDYLGDIKGETIQVLKNLQAVLVAGGATLDNVIKTTIFLNEHIFYLFLDIWNIYKPGSANNGTSCCVRQCAQREECNSSW